MMRAVMAVIAAIPLALGGAYAQEDGTAIYEIALAAVELALADDDAAAAHTEFASAFFAGQMSAEGEPDRQAHAEIHLQLVSAAAAARDRLPGADREARAAAEMLREAIGGRQASDADAVSILAAAERLYRSGIIYSDDASYETAAALIGRVAGADPPPQLAALQERVAARDADVHGVAADIAGIQRGVLGAGTGGTDAAALYSAIRSHYESLLFHADRGDYEAADESAIAAYLDNFEYLEPLIEEADEELMLSLEADMRVRLRELIRASDAAAVRELIAGSILPGLDKAEAATADATVSSVDGALAAPGRALAAMGSASDEQKEGVRLEIDRIRERMHEAELFHAGGSYELAYEAARSAYLDSYELVEVPLRAIDPDFTLEVEYQFATLRSLVGGPSEAADVRRTVAAIERNLDESERLVSGTGTLAPAIAFSSSFAIIFREGLESVLILGAILTYLEASRHTRFKKHVYYGVVAAIGATAATWAAASYLISISGASRELIEAVAALSATAILFYVSFWVLNKIEHKKWMEFVKAKVWQATAAGGSAVFVMLAFVTVYREGFETVLFYQAMSGFAKYSEGYVGAGFAAGMASLFGIYYVMRRLGRRLPLRALFGLTMGVGAYLSIAFLGNAVRELQILDIVPYTPMFGVIPRLDINVAAMTGIYPTLETVIAQIALLAVYMVAATYVLVHRPRRAARLAAMRKSRAGAQ